MSEILAGQGIVVEKFGNSEYYIKLDNEVLALLEYVKDLRTGCGTWNGYSLGTEIDEMLARLDSHDSILSENEYYKENNPAVKAAWEQYQIMLALARQEDKNNGA